MFANSSAETKTTTEKGFIEGFAKQVGDIGSIMIAILVAVLFTILLVVGNTMAQAVRERTSELAVLKTLGFLERRRFSRWCWPSRCSSRSWAEGSAWPSRGPIVARGDPTGGLLSPFVLPRADLVLGIGLMAGGRRRWRACCRRRARCGSRSPTR